MMSITAIAPPQVQSPQLTSQQQLPFQVGQPIQQPYGQQVQQPFGQLGQIYGQQVGQQPYAQFGPQIGQAWQQSPLAAVGAQVVSDTMLRVVSAALATVLEQLRIDPLAQQTLCAQGQLSPQAYSKVLTEAARRSAPIVA